MECGTRSAADVTWLMDEADREWLMEHGIWSVTGGAWVMECGTRSAADGAWLMVRG